jgi:hypothetical protein
MPAEPSSIEEVVRSVAAALERVGVEYAVGGIIASGLYGDPRATNDVDFAIRMTADLTPALVEALGPQFEVDEEALRDAIRRRRSWNIFHLPLMLKIALFARGKSALDDSELSRARALSLSPGTRPIRVSSPEDNLLWKLRWFRMGGEVSDQQWRDLQGIRRVSGPALDVSYLKHWASKLGVRDLVGRLFEEPPPKRRRKRKRG